jgi:hypothetical protein
VLSSHRQAAMPKALRSKFRTRVFFDADFWARRAVNRRRKQRTATKRWRRKLNALSWLEETC